jgi:hypothetical protein
VNRGIKIALGVIIYILLVAWHNDAMKEQAKMWCFYGCQHSIEAPGDWHLLCQQRCIPAQYADTYSRPFTDWLFGRSAWTSQ